MDYRSIKPTQDQLREFTILLESERWDQLTDWYR